MGWLRLTSPARWLVPPVTVTGKTLLTLHLSVNVYGGWRGSVLYVPDPLRSTMHFVELGRSKRGKGWVRSGLPTKGRRKVG